MAGRHDDDDRVPGDRNDLRTLRVCSARRSHEGAGRRAGRGERLERTPGGHEQHPARRMPRSSRRSTRRATRRCASDDRIPLPRAADAATGRPRDHGDDLRLVRRAHREEAQPARRGRGIRQFRDREGARDGARGRWIRRRSSPRSRRRATGPPFPRPCTHAHHVEPELVSLRRRLVASIVLAVPVILLSMIPALQFPGWQWVSLALATPVVTWAAWPFHQATWTNLRHGAVTMDTLISVGVGRRLSVVAVRAVLRRRRHDRHDARLHVDGLAQRRRRQPLSRGGLGRHDVRARRPVLRGAVQARGRRGAARAARPRGEGCRCPSERPRHGLAHRGADAGGRPPRRRRVRRAPRREDRDGRRRRHGDVGGRRVDRDGRIRPCRGRRGRPCRRRDRQRGRAPRRPRHPGGRATPSSPRWPGWWSRRSPARRRRSASPTGSRASSCRSSSRSHSRRSRPGCCSASRPPPRSAPLSPCSSSPAPARSGSRPRSRSSSAPAAARSSAS